ncbi:4Fe-4S dicluster domain-containing protein [Chloroflexota bacterium]
MMFSGWLLRKLVVNLSYIANYGYTDGSGDWYIVVDSDKCDGCGKCVEECPQKILEVIADDYDDLVITVKEDHRKKLKYVCASCKPMVSHGELPCVLACPTAAITHSW